MTLRARLILSFVLVVAVTALSDFEHCPLMYRWRYELRVPVDAASASAHAAGAQAPAVRSRPPRGDAAAAGSPGAASRASRRSTPATEPVRRCP